MFQGLSSKMEAYEKYNDGELLNGRYSKVADISEGSYGLVSLAQDLKQDHALVAVKYVFPMDYPRKKLLRQLSSATGRATSSPAKLRSNIEDSDSRRKSVMTALLEESAKEISFHKLLGHHPNIPDLIDSFGSCLVLEYCSRGDLYEAMQNDIGPTTSQDIKDVFLQILNALSFCHSKSVFHRDLKPENILIADDWSIKICDWGLATTEKIVTNKNEFDVGSERYMAPELFDQDLDSYDASKIDLWSVGVILLTLVFHKNPFQVANYTDKRFLQFSANREALFDFFSTMTSDFFGALRFCLNMDPSNRDLDGLSKELEQVKFFTIDEEYWAEHSDDEEEEDAGYEEDIEDDEVRAPEKQKDDRPLGFDHPFAFEEEDMFGFEKEPVEEPSQELSVIHDVSELSEETPPAVLVSRHIDVAPEYTTDSDATGNAYIPSREDGEMPYNRRADALLSPFTHMKPIPITGNIQIRNTRKPFGVASYNKNGVYPPSKTWIHGSSCHTDSHNSKFRREDFFTPRSTFTQYMDKYGEQRESRDPNRCTDRTSERKKKWKRGRKRQSWKKRPQRTFQNQAAIPHESSGKRRYSNTHRRRSSVKNSTPVPGMAQSPTSTQRTAGKYVPPFMRVKSPRIDALSENLGHLGLHDDEVFHLDEEEYTNHSQNANHNHANSNSSHGQGAHHGASSPLHNGIQYGGSHDHNSHSGGYHQVPTSHVHSLNHNFAHGHGFVPGFDSGSFSHRNVHSDHESRKTFLSNHHFHPNGTSPLVFEKRSESQMGVNSRRFLHGRSDPSGKYVPPFRRGSCSAAGGKQEKKRSNQPGVVYPSIQQTLTDSETSRSVPADHWFLKKE